MSVVDGIAIIGSQRFGADASPGSTFTIPVAGFAVGDLVVYCQLAEHTGAAIPASVFPAGFVAIGASKTLVDGAGLGCRMNTAYKIMTAADIAAPQKTGMAGTNRNRVCAIIFHMNRPLTSVIVDSSSIALGLADTDVSPLTAAWSGLFSHGFLYLGFAHGDAAFGPTQFSWSTPATGSDYIAGTGEGIGTGTAQVTRTHYKYKPFGFTSPPDNNIDMSMVGDRGDFNSVAAILLRLD
jgi:hypothetical protein